jgi:hypothetical protein
MRKEVVFAIIIGLILGAVILVGWQLADQSAKQAVSTTAQTPQANPDLAPPETPVSQGISVIFPQSHAVVNTDSLKIIGKTFPNASIAAIGAEDEAIVTADKDGNFSVDLTLIGGENVIELTVLKDDLTTDSTKISLIYTTAKLTSDVMDPITASPSAIVDKVVKAALDKNLKNVQEANLLVGYAGIINDIKLGVFNLTTGQVNLQISYDSKTTIIKDGKTLKPELLTVKDKAIVIGNMSSPDILVAKRIVISSKDEIPVIEKRVIYSPIVKIKGNILTLNIDGKNQDVTIGKKLKLDPKTLTADNKIFAILLMDTGGKATLLQAKTI